MSEIYPKKITKPWGEETWLELNNSYCLKRIFIKEGARTSLQYHERKKETNYVLSGEAEVTLGRDKDSLETRVVGPGIPFTIIPRTIHRMRALTDLTFIEVSTPEVDDVIRIQDDSGRGDGRIESEHGP